jgi:hypothetical protein
MNKKLVFEVMLVGLVALVTVLVFTQSSQNVRWEYSFITVATVSDAEVKAKADVLGKEGWELVSGSIKGSSTEKFLSFKRRLP